MTKLPLLVTVRALVLVAVMGALGAGVWELARPPLVAVVARPGDLAFAEALEAVCVETVESGKMTKDLALLVGPQTPWLTTQEFLGALDANLRAKVG